MGRIGIPELLLILLILVLVFGANRLPELGRGLGKAIRGFKDATHEDDHRDDPPATRLIRSAFSPPPPAASSVPGPGIRAAGSRTCARRRSASLNVADVDSRPPSRRIAALQRAHVLLEAVERLLVEVDRVEPDQDLLPDEQLARRGP